MKKGKCKKGVTLVELIAVIAILGVISTIGFTIYGSTKKKILEKDYNNLVSFIETKAEKYASDTGIKNVNVETLIKEGYIDADDKEGNLYDPVTKKPLNCYVIKNDLKGSDFLATFDKEGGSQVTGGICKEVLIEKAYTIFEKNNKDLTKWSNSDVTLVVNERVNDVWKPLNQDYNFRWYNKKGLNLSKIQNEYTVGMSGIHEFSVEVKEKNPNGAILGVAETIIKIDKEDPVLNATVDSTDYKQSHDVTITASDSLSGIGNIKVFDLNDNSKELFTKDYTNKKEVTETVTGIKSSKIKIVATDLTGKSVFKELDLNIDSGIDSVTIAMNPTRWAKEVTLTGSANDTRNINKYEFYKIGIDKAQSSNIVNPALQNVTGTYSGIKSNGIWKFCAYDTVGNKACSDELTIDNIDNEKPTATITKEKNGSTSVTLKLTLNDKHSGLKNYAISTSNNINSIDKWIDLSELSEKTANIDKKIEQNGIYYLHVHDNVDNLYSSNKIEINTIDKQDPTSSISKNTSSYVEKVTLTGKGTDDMGIVAYAFTNSSSIPSTWNNITSSKDITKTKEVTSNGTYYFHVKDVAGKVKSSSVVVNNIDRENPTANITKNTSNYVSSITLTGTGTDDIGIVAYNFTTSSSTPRSWTTISRSKNISKTKNVTSNGTYYFWVKDVMGKTSYASISITNIDTQNPTASISRNTSNVTDRVTLTGKGTDDYGIEYYAFTTSSLTPSSWTSTSGKSITKTKTVYSNGTYYFHVKDKAGKTNYDYINITNIDNEAPVYNYGGTPSTDGNSTCNVSVSTAYFTDKSSYTVYYYFSTSSYTPSSSSITSTSRSPYTSCNQWYYVWCKAIDKWGNESNVKYLGNVYSGNSCSEGTWEIDDYYCDSDGWRREERYNECSGQYEHRYYPDVRHSCRSNSFCDSYGSCGSDGYRYRDCWYYEGGYKYYDGEESDYCGSSSGGGSTNTDQNVCVEDSICSNEQWSYAMISNKEKWHNVNTRNRNILHSCNVCLANNYCTNAEFRSNGYWYVTLNPENNFGVSGEAKVDTVGDLTAFCE